MTNVSEKMREALEAGRLPEAPLSMPVQKLTPAPLSVLLRSMLQFQGRRAES